MGAVGWHPPIFAPVATFMRTSGGGDRSTPIPPGTSPARSPRMLDARQYLDDHIHEAPVWMVPCLAGANPSRRAGSSIYPAVQNMLLAARARGLGATLTTLYRTFEKEVEAALGL